MKQITKTELKDLMMKVLSENTSCESGEQHFIININGITIYYSDYRITEIDNDDFSIGFYGWNNGEYQCSYSSWSMNVVYIDYQMYEIV